MLRFGTVIDVLLFLFLVVVSAGAQPAEPKVDREAGPARLWLSGELDEMFRRCRQDTDVRTLAAPMN